MEDKKKQIEHYLKIIDEIEPEFSKLANVLTKKITSHPQRLKITGTAIQLIPGGKFPSRVGQVL